MPSLPPGPPPELLHAAVKYVNFPGGRGVRYVAAYSFDASPVVRSQVSYVFQGLTNDGKYLVSWGQQVTLKEIPTDYDTTPVLRRVQEDIFGGVKGAWEKHQAGVTRTLDGLTN